MRFAAARRAEEDQVGAFFEPGVASGKRHDLGFRDHRHGVEVEAVEGLGRRQAGVVEMAGYAPARALGDLMLGQGDEEACGGPSLLVGARGEVGPDELDRRKAQLDQEQGEPGGVGRVGLHATALPSTSAMPTWASSS